MKKRYVILAALLVTALAAAGCGKKQTEDTGKDGQVTVAPAENTDTASSDDSSLVDMQKSDDADIKNVIGDKTSTASKLILVMIGYVTYVGNTSMEVEIDSYVERGDGMRYLVNRAFSVMVAVDENERPTRIPGLIIHTEAEKGRHEAALLRRDMRKERRDAGF